jgi:putative endonuclease
MRAPLPFTALARSIAARFGRYESRPVPSLPTPAAIGSYGERVAAAFLSRHGYSILYRNFATEEGELDVVCRCGAVLAFVEVRTRAGSEFGRPVETIDSRKAGALRAAATTYLGMLEDDKIFHRFDAVEVMLREGEIPACTLIQNVFT